MRQRGTPLVASLIVLLGGSISPANPTVRLSGIDGSTMTCTFLGATDETVVVECPERTTLSLDAVHAITIAATPERPLPTTHAAIVYPSAGGRIRATISGGSGESVVVDSTLGSNINLPLSRLAGVWFRGDESDSEGRTLFDELMSDRLAGKDVLVVERDGELSTIRGGVLSLGPEGGRFMYDRKERAFQLDNLVGIVLATGVGGDGHWPATVRLLDGGEFAGRLRAADDTTMTFAASWGADVTVPLDALSDARFRSDRVVYLSDLSPVRTNIAGLLHEPSPVRFDRSVANFPMSLGGTRYDRGLGVQARTELVYAIDGAYDSFAATIGIDDAVRPRGNVVFRVEGDSRVLFESGPITGRDVPQPVALDVGGIRELTLVVDYGDGMDLSDQADWADARLIEPPMQE